MNAVLKFFLFLCPLFLAAEQYEILLNRPQTASLEEIEFAPTIIDAIRKRDVVAVKTLLDNVPKLKISQQTGLKLLQIADAEFIIATRERDQCAGYCALYCACFLLFAEAGLFSYLADHKICTITATVFLSLSGKSFWNSLQKIRQHDAEITKTLKVHRLLELHLTVL